MGQKGIRAMVDDKLSQRGLLQAVERLQDVEVMLLSKAAYGELDRWYAEEWSKCIAMANELMQVAHAMIIQGSRAPVIDTPQVESPTYIVQDYWLHVMDGELYIGLDFGFDTACWLFVPPVDDLEILGDTIEDARQRMAWVRERNGRE